jgi:hypothetical protein
VDRERIIDLIGREDEFKSYPACSYAEVQVKGKISLRLAWRKGFVPQEEGERKGDGPEYAVERREVEFKTGEHMAPRLAHNGVDKTRCWGRR